MRERSVGLLPLVVLVWLSFCGISMAQFTIKLPKIKKEQPKTEQTPNPAEKDQSTGRAVGGFDVLSPPKADSIPRLLRDSLEINVRTEIGNFPSRITTAVGFRP